MSGNSAKSTIAVIDYGMGNLRSVSKALEHVAPDQQVMVTNNSEQIHAADRVVFPGVGAMRDCMAELESRNLVTLIKEIAQDRPFLGVCLGMQSLLERSAENSGVESFGIFDGECKRFDDGMQENDEILKIPHMGWNEVMQVEHPLWQGIPDRSRFYFVHSYYAAPKTVDEFGGKTHYGIDFCSVLAQDNIFATQFHPEKSQHAGLQLLKNFTQWDGKR